MGCFGCCCGFTRLLFVALLICGTWSVPDSSGLDLQRERLSPQYRERLGAAGSRFGDWCLKRGRPLLVLVEDIAELNEVLIQYVQELYESRRPVSEARHTILAVQTIWRHLRRQLKPA